MIPLTLIFIYFTIYLALFTGFYFLISFFEDPKKFRSPIPKKFPKVTVIVPAYNEEKTISKTLNSLLELDYPKDKLQIIAIDDGSKDSTYNIAKTFEKKGVLVLTKENNGKGAALNYAMQYANGDIVGALDADSRVAKDALKKMVGFFEEEKITAVTPCLKVENPKGFLARIQEIEYLIGIFLRKVFSLMGALHVTPGPFTMYRKSFFDKYGGFDENNITEDIEVALRMQTHNLLAVNSIDAEVFTISPTSFISLLRQRIRWYLGFLDNTLQFTHLFHPKYGILAIMILPLAYVSVATAVFAMSYLLYRIIISTINIFNLIRLFGSDFELIRSFLKFDLSFFTIGSVVILSTVAFFLYSMQLIIAKKESNDKSKISKGFLFYMAGYGILFGFWWISAAFYKLFAKEVRFGAVRWNNSVLSKIYNRLGKS